ncbi:MAG: fatty acid desaturase [Ketobacteraceae bacterium]|nr:fatty acid desaturase [Ketobacteraceae bacterium]
MLTIIRVMGVSISYHRYFSHRAFETSRAFRFFLIIWGGITGQRDPLWWAAQHRHHHKYSDQPEDQHSPQQYPLWYSHMGWVMKKESTITRFEFVKELKKDPELMWFNRYPYFVFAMSLVLVTLFGWWMQVSFPELNTGPLEMLFWGGFNSFLACSHITLGLNSLNHWVGKKELPTKDQSTNVWWLFPFLLGENWHNNHHYYPSSASTWVKWYQVDLIYLTIKLFEKLGLVWNVRTWKERKVTPEEAIAKT